MLHVDLAIIGSGSGNSLVTPDFADKDVVVIDGGTFGGTCLNVGCIPTKMFVYAAEVARTVRGASRYGVDASVDGVRWRDIRDRVFGRIDPISAGGLDYRRHGEHTDALVGMARFVGERELEVTAADGSTQRLTADQIVIAAGARPVIPPVIADSGVPYVTNDDVMRLDELPGRLLIVGGGYIAAEFAHVFSALGSEVTLIVRGPAMLRGQDESVSQEFTKLAQEEWDVHLGTQVTQARTVPDPATPEGRCVVLTLSDGSEVSGDVLLVAAGRRPATDGLAAEAGGVAVREDGRVQVDEHGRTTAEGVWALGDISSPYQLKHVANHEARVVAHNLAHPADLRSFDHRHVPAAVFTHPQIASVGATEQELRERGVRYASAVQRYGDTAFGWAMEDSTGFCKVLADPTTGALLGCHIMGPDAATLIQPAIQAIGTGQSVQEVARSQYWIHPALTEVLENALLGLGITAPDEVLDTPVEGPDTPQP